LTKEFWSIGRGHDGVAAAAGAVARFQHDEGEAGIFQRMRGAEACGTRADDGDVDGGGEGSHALGSSTFAIDAKAAQSIAVITRESG
jgi:hypothetical protein